MRCGALPALRGICASVAVPRSQDVLTHKALVEAVGGDVRVVYHRAGRGRGGVARIDTKAAWSSVLSAFFHAMPRSATTQSLLRTSADAIDAACTAGASKALSAEARWEVMPYGSAVMALKSVCAVAHDGKAHPFLVRLALPAALRALRLRWAEGAAVATHALEVLCQLADHQVPPLSSVRVCYAGCGALSHVRLRACVYACVCDPPGERWRAATGVPV